MSGEKFDPVGALDRHARSTKREWKHDRSNTVGASEVGQCARKVFFTKNEGSSFGRDRDAAYEDRWGATAPGTVYEDVWWAPAMAAEAERVGGRLLYAGEQQRTLVSGFLSATPDGLVVIDDEHEFALECKTRDPRARRGEPKPEHVFQVQVQLGLIRERTNHKPAYGLLIYTDRSFWDDIEVHRIDFDPGVYGAAKARARLIMTAADPWALKPEGVIAGGRECEYCPFTAACGRARAAAVPAGAGAVDEETAKQIAAFAEEIKILDARADHYATEKRTAEDELKRLMRAQGIRKAVTDGYSVSWSSVSGRESWDHKGIRAAAEAAGIDLTPYARTGEPSDRLTIQLKNSPAAS